MTFCYHTSYLSFVSFGHFQNRVLHNLSDKQFHSLDSLYLNEY